MSVPAQDGRDVRRALASVTERIAQACRRAGRDPSGVRLIGVTKTVPEAAIRPAVEAGLTDLGENYAGELAVKARAIEARWHFLGKVQRGTAARIAEFASVIHSAEPGSGIESVGRRAAAIDRVVDCLVQVDFTGRRQGVRPQEVASFLEEAAAMPGLRFIGLMTLPPPAADPEHGRPFFARLRTMATDLRKRWPGAVELSMGMSGDFPVAVEEGATMVRVGTALFGERPVQDGDAHGRESAGGGASAR